MTFNPFFHGIEDATVSRQLFIRPHDGEPTVFRPIKSQKQLSLPDHCILGCDCRIYEDHAEIIEDPRPADNDDDADYTLGEILQVIYSVEGKCGTENIHMGDHYSAGDAKNAIDKIGSSCISPLCCEISTGNICEDANWWLVNHTGARLEELYINVVKMDDGFLIKIIAAPWSDELLQQDGLSAAQLKEQQKAAGMPDSLVDLLHMAAEAKVRILILDPDADALEGLPVYDW